MKTNSPLDIVWTTKEGKSMPLRNMTDDHLRNATNMIKRKRDDLDMNVLSHPPCFQGEMAQMYADQQYNEAWKEHDQLSFLFEEMEKACKIRNIKL